MRHLDVLMCACSTELNWWCCHRHCKLVALDLAIFDDDDIFLDCDLEEWKRLMINLQKLQFNLFEGTPEE